MYFDKTINPDNIFSNLPVVTDNDGESLVVTPNSDYQLPENIQRHDFFTSHGVPIRYYTAPSEHEQKVIMGASGYKHDFVLDIPQIKTLNNQGFSVSWLAIPNPKRHVDFMNYLLEAVRETILAPRHSEIRRWCSKSSDKFFFGHSTGAQLFLRSAEDESSLNRLNQLFSGAVLSSVYVSPPNLESSFSPASILYNGYARWNHDQLPSETKGGQLYLRDTERNDFIPDEHADHIEPTYAQTRILQKGGQCVWNATQDLNSNLHKIKFPLFFAAGENDKFSSPFISADMAKNLRAAFLYALEKGHAPFSGTSTNIQIAIDAMHAMSSGNFQSFKTENQLDNYSVKRERFPVTKLACTAAYLAAVSTMQRIRPLHHPEAPHTQSESAHTP